MKTLRSSNSQAEIEPGAHQQEEYEREDGEIVSDEEDQEPYFKIVKLSSIVDHHQEEEDLARSKGTLLTSEPITPLCTVLQSTSESKDAVPARLDLDNPNKTGANKPSQDSKVAEEVQMQQSLPNSTQADTDGVVYNKTEEPPHLPTSTPTLETPPAASETASTTVLVNQASNPAAAQPILPEFQSTPFHNQQLLVSSCVATLQALGISPFLSFMGFPLAANYVPALPGASSTSHTHPLAQTFTDFQTQLAHQSFLNSQILGNLNSSPVHHGPTQPHSLQYGINQLPPVQHSATQPQPHSLFSDPPTESQSIGNSSASNIATIPEIPPFLHPQSQTTGNFEQAPLQNAENLQLTNSRNNDTLMDPFADSKLPSVRRESGSYFRRERLRRVKERQRLGRSQEDSSSITIQQESGSGNGMPSHNKDSSKSTGVSTIVARDMVKNVALNEIQPIIPWKPASQVSKQQRRRANAKERQRMQNLQGNRSSSSTAQLESGSENGMPSDNQDSSKSTGVSPIVARDMVNNVALNEIQPIIPWKPAPQVSKQQRRRVNAKERQRIQNLQGKRSGSSTSQLESGSENGMPSDNQDSSKTGVSTIVARDMVNHVVMNETLPIIPRKSAPQVSKQQRRRANAKERQRLQNLQGNRSSSSTAQLESESGNGMPSENQESSKTTGVSTIVGRDMVKNAVILNETEVYIPSTEDALVDFKPIQIPSLMTVKPEIILPIPVSTASDDSTTKPIPVLSGSWKTYYEAQSVEEPKRTSGHSPIRAPGITEDDRKNASKEPLEGTLEAYMKASKRSHVLDRSRSPKRARVSDRRGSPKRARARDRSESPNPARARDRRGSPKRVRRAGSGSPKRRLLELELDPPCCCRMMPGRGGRSRRDLDQEKLASASDSKRGTRPSTTACYQGKAVTGGGVSTETWIEPFSVIPIKSEGKRIPISATLGDKESARESHPTRDRDETKSRLGRNIEYCELCGSGHIMQHTNNK